MGEEEIQREIEKISKAQQDKSHRSNRMILSMGAGFDERHHDRLSRSPEATIPVIEAQRRSNSLNRLERKKVTKIAPVAHAVHGAVAMAVEADMVLHGNKLKLPDPLDHRRSPGPGAEGGGEKKLAEVEKLREEIEGFSQREASQVESLMYFEGKVKSLEKERGLQEEELCLWRMQFAELQSAGVLSGIKTGPGSIWASLAALDATPT